MSIINGVGRVGWRTYASVTPVTPSYPSSLKFFIDAGNPSSYPGTGTTVTDLTTNTNNGVLINGTTYSSENGGMLVFDGINDYIDFDNLIAETANTANDSFTYLVWFKPAALPAGGANLFSRNTNSLGNQLLRTEGSVIRGGVQDVNGNGLVLTGTTTLNTNTYYQAAYTYDGTTKTVKLYLNNNLESQGTSGSLTGNLFNINKVYVGQRNSDLYFKGNLSIAKYYQEARTAAQIAEDFNTYKSRYGYPTYTTRTTAFAAATGITDTTILNALNTFDTGLISNGLDTKMKALYPFVGGTSNTHKFNFMDARDSDAAFRLQFNGGWIHSSNGALPNGTNGYADTYLIPNNTLTQDSTSLSFYSNENSIPSLVSIIGTRSSNFNENGQQISIDFYSNTLYSRLYSQFGGQNTISLSRGDGMYMTNRISSSSHKIYRNGSQLGSTSTTSGGSINQIDLSMYLSAYHTTTTGALFFSPKRMSFVHIGDGLTDSEASTLYTLTQAFQTSLSRQV